MTTKDDETCGAEIDVPAGCIAEVEVEKVYQDGSTETVVDETVGAGVDGGGS